MNFFFNLVFIILATSLFVGINIGQTKQDAKSWYWGIPQKPQKPEIAFQNIGQVRELLKESPNPNGFIILIARLGKSETSRDLNRRRLHNVKAALALPSERIIETEGERVDDYGRVEVYWNGELVGGLPALKNLDLITDCCGPDSRYYPYKTDKIKKALRKSVIKSKLKE